MKILVTKQVPECTITKLRDHNIDVNIQNSIEPLSPSLLKEMIPEYDGLICLLNNAISREIIESAPHLKIIANYAVGFNNIDIEAARQHKIFITNTPGVLTEATADLTFALMLAAARRIVESDHFCRDEKFTGWDPILMLGKELYGSTLGLVGLGRIGTAVMRRAYGFGMRLLYFSRTRHTEQEQQYQATWVDLDTLTRSSDIISLHIPLTPETRGMFHRDRILQMKPGSIMINTARGELLDEEALTDALASHHLMAAGLDVFEQEPKIYPRLLNLPNVVLAPHIGSATLLTRERMGIMVADNIIAVMQGKQPPNWVNAPF